MPPLQPNREQQQGQRQQQQDQEPPKPAMSTLDSIFQTLRSFAESQMPRAKAAGEPQASAPAAAADIASTPRALTVPAMAPAAQGASLSLVPPTRAPAPVPAQPPPSPQIEDLME
jgi:hypothetical protein